ncbi:putative bifunctional diguanylate cyclase/phosphodiesterase [Cohnella faecalis]|uniref:EAL domain-containing protein n=1 Tax=Cohnella faecalis TaxID=2315694 RepID=A0A398CPM8_9BACL|nr:EAL domain-containing protein [Cohnella faecalis]RIE01837.1 EAL domain-containing protein [Cohnella faecalis]
MNLWSQDLKPRQTTSLSTWGILLLVFLFLGGLITGFAYLCKDRLAEEVYRDASAELTANASSLKLSIERRLLMSEGLKAFTYTELIHNDGSVDPVRFDSFASHFTLPQQGIRNLSIYPNGIARFIYPLQGNEKVLGLDLFAHSDPKVRLNAERTKELTRVTLLGPFELTQGGSGLLTRQSVFFHDRFWGFVSVVLDVPPILEEAGLKAEDKGIELAVRADGQVIFGNPKLFDDASRLRETVSLTEGAWEMAAVPKSERLESISSKVRLIVLFSTLSMLLLMFLLYVLLTQKTKLQKKVNERTVELVEANQHIEATYEELLAVEEELREQYQVLEGKEQSLRHMAYHDLVTGLHNRTFFNERLEDQISAAKRSHRSMALLFLDLDQFKLVNDTLGHAFGDLLLNEVGKRLSEELTGEETVSRIGGDEFTIVMPNVCNPDEARQVAERVVGLFQQPFLLHDSEYFITSSIGIALYPEHGEDAATLTKNADKAMYRAKDEGKNNYKFYDSNRNSDVEEKMEIKNSLRRALERDEFDVHYQPQIQVETGQLIGMEALIRWHHPKRGTISPATFIPVAEETGMIVPMGEWILRKACAQNKAWQDAGLPPIRMAVNLSARQFGHNNLLESIRRILEETGLDPQYLELEITENLAMKDESLPTLTELRSMGITISIDDFGTQHSSLGYLKRLPVNRIKIDRSFIWGIGKDTRDEAIILAMLLVAQRLELSILAEGVETEEQFAFLQKHGCDDIQGFLFYRPQPADLIQKVLLDHLK